MFEDIDNRIVRGERIILAVEGMAASGKTTLATKLAERYGCSVIPMDHFFLRPEQRTPLRLAEPGGNIDYARFAGEVTKPLRNAESFSYRPYDCSAGELAEPILVTSTPLTVVEGVYSMHPHFAAALYNICIFLRLDEKTQHTRLKERNPNLYERFVNEWLPMENMYFESFGIKDKCDYVFRST